MPYGEWMVGVPPIEPLHADRMSGVQLSYDIQRRPEWVDIQWQSGTDKRFHQLQMDFPNALRLLSMLKAMQLDSGVEFPDDPRPPTRR
jgi:hypothetical protein